MLTFDSQRTNGFHKASISLQTCKTVKGNSVEGDESGRRTKRGRQRETICTLSHREQMDQQTGPPWEERRAELFGSTGNSGANCQEAGDTFGGCARVCSLTRATALAHWSWCFQRVPDSDGGGDCGQSNSKMFSWVSWPHRLGG